MFEIIPNFHPAIVHFPIAFSTAAVAFFMVGVLFKKRPYAAQCLMMGRWMLLGAVLFALIAVVFGWFAFNSVAHDEVSHAAMKVHRNWALVALTTLLVPAVWSGRSGKMLSPNIPSRGFLVLLVAAWLLVMSTAWHGAELVYRYGLGVMALPDAYSEQDTAPRDAVGHEHNHIH